MLTCPICKKNGIPNYNLSHVVCPQCNSDLKPFMLLHSLKAIFQPRPSRSYKGMFITSCIFLAISLLIVYQSEMSISTNVIIIRQLKDSITVLSDLNAEVSISKKDVAGNGNGKIVAYHVKRKDTLTKIAKMFFNSSKLYSTIAADNKITKPYLLKTGQIILLRLE